MLHKKPFNVVQCCIVAAVMSLSLASLAHATDSRIELKTETKTKSSNAQPETHQPQQATPSKPASETEPVDGDETALA